MRTTLCSLPLMIRSPSGISNVRFWLRFQRVSSHQPQQTVHKPSRRVARQPRRDCRCKRCRGIFYAPGPAGPCYTNALTASHNQGRSGVTVKAYSFESTGVGSGRSCEMRYCHKTLVLFFFTLYALSIPVGAEIIVEPATVVIDGASQVEPGDYFYYDPTPVDSKEQALTVTPGLPWLCDAVNAFV